ncbi:PREDICTED: latent-transforming growth factor beta-binding protein 4-like [Branchiostoma belcheri]|uniref:Latent-transforming growth factor beta-binding protein 4-like n=1 Tax=Branchiostoma belcheri TaxID=7741 RepID=A0A6P4ZVB9_BRABE|nr:PREDICTED: latent-transforming growth factor beta-binding protein 4-like [Branchiostoma belcheri]
MPTRKNCETTSGLCPNGRCINFRDSYICNCNPGYRYDSREKTCVERPGSICETMLNLCPNGRCRPSGNSYTCVCNPGYKLDPVRKTCVAERSASVCESRPGLCRNGRCVDSRGSYLCMCNTGYRQDLGGRACVDINECSYRNGRCHHGTCVNTAGSFTCSCDDGYRLSPDRKSCIDLDECPSQTTCTSPNQCLNFMGSYYCMCSAGYRHHGDNTKACIEEEINECRIDPTLCQNGECINTRGSFVCKCDPGYKTDDTMTQCLDEDECQLDPTLCPNGRCHNSQGSYVCICDRGYRSDASRTQCLDVDECEANAGLCRDGECVNTPGGYRCRCDQGYVPSPDQRACVDVDECTIGNPCGQSVCQNLPGHFTCVCTQGLVFDEDRQRCVSAWLAEQTQSRKQCFSDSKDLDFGCGENAAGFNVTKEECCCSLGVAWGDSCELFMCPGRNAAEYLELCALTGFLMKHDQNNEMYIEDINECDLFNNPCNNAMCRNTPGSYVCICPAGYFLNEQELTCTDINECAQFPCGSGTCLNLPGSYECNCLGNQIPDPTKKRCIERPLTLPLEPPAASYVFEQHEVCWTSVIGPNLFCSNALPFNMTRAQCCCRSDVQAWGVDCQLCPKLGTDAFRDLCERIKPGTSVDQQAFYIENIVYRLCKHDMIKPGMFPPGPVAGQVPLIPGQQPGRPGWMRPYVAPERVQPPAQLPPGILAPRQGQPSVTYLPAETPSLEREFPSEPLDADCQIEGGCGFGRCLRVDGGGYICDCYSGYKLDSNGLKCVDMNECEELGDLCKNGKCINTAGSYVCQCHPGHAPKPDQPNFCVEQQGTETPTQDSLSRTEE